MPDGAPTGDPPPPRMGGCTQQPPAPPHNFPCTGTERGGGNGPRVGTPAPWAGTQGPWVGTQAPLAHSRQHGGWWGPPVNGSSRRRPPAACSDPRIPPRIPPLQGRRGLHVRFEPASPTEAVYRQCGPPGQRTGPALPRAPPPPPPTPAGAIGLTAPGELLCRGGEATGRFVPASNGGLYPRHGAQTPVGGSNPTPHHHTEATGRRE